MFLLDVITPIHIGIAVIIPIFALAVLITLFILIWKLC